MSSKLWVANLLISFIPLQLLGQLQQNQRLEIPVYRNEGSFEVLSAKEDGVVLYRTLTQSSSQFQLIYVDTAFRQKWTGVLPIENKLQLAQSREANKKIYFLFHRKDFTEINFYLYEVDLLDGSFKKFVIGNFIPFLPTHLELTGKGALVGGYFTGRIPVVLFFDFSTQKGKVLPGLFNEPGELIQINCNADDTFNVLINSKNNLKQRTLWIKNYSDQGGLLQNTILKPEETSSLLFGRIINLDNNMQLIAGVYGNRSSDYSKGLFLARIDEGSAQQLVYYPFTHLENFFKYMKAKQEHRVKKRIERRQIKGKKIRLHYRFLVHEFVRYQNSYILLGEAFYPRYKSLDRNYTYGMAPGYQTVFDGYQYTHAIIIGFDSSGKLKWDNSFEINDVRTFTLEQYVKMDIQEDKVALLYLFDDKVRSKIIQNNKVLEGKVYNQLNMQFEETFDSDKTNVNKLDYWYHDNFLAYGTQGITYWGNKGKPREIFFVNKLRYR